MGAEWQYQLRLYLPEGLAGLARTDPGAPAIRPLAEVLDAHRATLVSQIDAFEAYVAEAEREYLLIPDVGRGSSGGIDEALDVTTGALVQAADGAAPRPVFPIAC